MSDPAADLLCRVRRFYGIDAGKVARLFRGQGTRNWILEGSDGRIFVSEIGRAPSGGTGRGAGVIRSIAASEGFRRRTSCRRWTARCCPERAASQYSSSSRMPSRRRCPLRLKCALPGKCWDESTTCFGTTRARSSRKLGNGWPGTCIGRGAAWRGYPRPYGRAAAHDDFDREGPPAARGAA